MKNNTEKQFDYAVGDCISKLGIGGRISAEEILKAYREIDAILFAKIMYATDHMMHNFEGTDCEDPAKIMQIIDERDFSRMPHFDDVADIFRNHFGDDTARS